MNQNLDTIVIDTERRTIDSLNLNDVVLSAGGDRYTVIGLAPSKPFDGMNPAVCVTLAAQDGRTSTRILAANDHCQVVTPTKPRTMKVRIDATVEVNLDAYEAEYGRMDRDEIRQEVKTGISVAFHRGVVYADENIAEVIRIK